MRHTAAGLGKLFNFVVIDMDGMREPDVVPQPAVRLHPIHRAKLVTLELAAPSLNWAGQTVEVVMAYSKQS